LMQDHQTWCGSISWNGAVSRTITRSLWPTFLLLKDIKWKPC